MFGIFDAAESSQDEFALALIEDSTGYFKILVDESAANFFDGNVVGSQAIGIDFDIDGAAPAAGEEDVADPLDGLEEFLDIGAGDFGDFADIAIAGDDDGDDGSSIEVEFVDEGRIHSFGKGAGDRGDFVAGFLRADISIFFEDEADDDGAGTFAGGRAELIDSGDGIEGFFEGFGDGAFHFFGAGTRKGCADGDDGEVDFGEEVNTDLEVGNEAEDHGNGDEDPSENWAANASIGQVH